ncbi:hypothetical protein [Algibacter sp. 2305UL17-15]|uniref:hypothetical protein n=1 Tax=Algibacter sp. 2305UL17-15 TaxID=3231268 RepID=UPI00345A5EFB
MSGKVVGVNNVENIHIINKTAQKFTITDKNGEFTIPVKLNDTLSFSSVQHQSKEIVVSKEIINAKTVIVKLEEQVNILDEVTVGKVLTGDLLSDIDNIEGKAPINFYDLGIPGYTGKPATQSERRLNAATTGANGQKLKWYSPLTGQIPIDPIINEITGRTKMLKARVKHENSEALMNKLRSKFSEILFSINPLEEAFRADFFYFCEMDENFYSKCAGKPDLEVLEFLKEKLRQYKANQQELKN